MFLTNCWYVAAWPSEILSGAMLTRRILDQPVLLYRTAGGSPVAFLDRCPHRLVPLSAGTLVGDAVRCGYHGMVFGPDGRCVEIPGQASIPSSACARTFPTTERHGHVWIWMGEPALADAALVPHVPWPALDSWTPATGYTHVAADYRLLTDNLLDLSHENYIHADSIGNEEEETIASFSVRIQTEGGRLVRCHRDMPGIIPPPFFRLMMGSNGRIDRWQTAIWTAPGVNMTDVGARPVGAGREQTFVTRVLHLLTPETERSTHYFWSHSRNFRHDEAALTDAIADGLRRTFDEDKAMLEMQQAQMYDARASVPQIALKVDDAPLRARRLLATLIKEEQAAGTTTLAKEQLLIPDQDALEPVLA